MLVTKCDTQDKIMGWMGDVNLGWMRKVDEEIQRVGAKAGIEVNKTDRGLYLLLIEGQEWKGKRPF